MDAISRHDISWKFARRRKHKSSADAYLMKRALARIGTVTRQNGGNAFSKFNSKRIRGKILDVVKESRVVFSQ